MCTCTGKARERSALLLMGQDPLDLDMNRVLIPCAGLQDAVGTSTEKARERCALLRMGHDTGEQLVGTTLEHIGTALERSLPAAEALLAPQVLGLLDPSRPVYAHLRRKVLPTVCADLGFIFKSSHALCLMACSLNECPAAHLLHSCTQQAVLFIRHSCC